MAFFKLRYMICFLTHATTLRTLISYFDSRENQNSKSKYLPGEYKHPVSTCWGLEFFPRESKYEIRVLRVVACVRKNVIYRNLKNAILKGISWKNDKKEGRKKLELIDRKRTAERPNGRTAYD